MNNNDEQLLLTNGQIIASSLFLITIGISIVLLYNQKLILENKEPILTEQEALDIALFIKVLATILLAFFLYTSVKEYEKNKNTKKEEDSFIQVIASSLVLIAAIITLFVIVKNYNANSNNLDISIDTPEI